MLVDLQVGTVRSEAVGDTREAVDNEGGGCGMVGEMRVAVLDALLLDLQSRIHCLGENRQRAEEIVAAAEVGADQRPECAQVYAGLPQQEVELRPEHPERNERVEMRALDERLRLGVYDGAVVGRVEALDELLPDRRAFRVDARVTRPHQRV